MSDVLLKTPLYDEHVALGAKMVPFGGWDMPVQYEGILAEYKATREKSALFDISHMGEFIIQGDLKTSGLDKIVTMDLHNLPVHSSRYGFMLDDNGYVLDDLIVFRIAHDRWFLVVNAATAQKDAEHIKANLTSNAVFDDISMKTGKLDIQGPLSRKILQELVPTIDKLDYFTFDYFNCLGENALISRTGYTGELGYEIFLPWEKTKDLWQKLLCNDTVIPAGLGARDVLRLEVGYPLYGHELNDHTTPLEAGLNRFVDFKKDFNGKEALVQQQEKGLNRKLVGFVSDNRRAPREGYELFDADQQLIGNVTSGSFSPSMGKGIGVGFINKMNLEKDADIFFNDKKTMHKAKIFSRIFFRNGSLKN